MESEDHKNSKVLSCRACLQTTSVMYPLFDEYEAGISMASILETYLPSKISDHVNLPNQLCIECSITLVKFHNFIVIFGETQNQLNKLQTATDNCINLHEEDFSLDCEQIIIQGVGCEEENEYTTEIKPETFSGSIEYTEDSEEMFQCVENNSVETLKVDEKEENHVLSENHYETNVDILENVKQYHCPCCDDVFLYIEILNNHLKKSHNIFKLEGPVNTTVIKRRIFVDLDDNTGSNNKIPKGEMQSCKSCGKTFRSVKSLHIHESSHKRNKHDFIIIDRNSEKQFICDVCGRDFKKKSYLNEHLEIHDSVRRLHKCPICHKQFKGRSNFARHKRFHFQAKKQHICEACGVGFNMRSTLKTHFFLKHVGKRNFQCLICSQFFSLKSTLEKHLRRHQYREGSAQAVKFSCSICCMKYLDKSSLKRHVELKHDNIKFECTDCDKDYTAFTNLTKHRMKKHPDKPIDAFGKRKL